MAIDVTNVASVDTEPGTLPETMAAWVIRQEREGQPSDAFQLEEIEVPEPGAFEVIVRVMAAGVNYNNVWLRSASRSRSSATPTTPSTGTTSVARMLPGSSGRSARA